MARRFRMKRRFSMRSFRPRFNMLPRSRRRRTYKKPFFKKPMGIIILLGGLFAFWKWGLPKLKQLPMFHKKAKNA